MGLFADTWTWLRSLGGSPRLERLQLKEAAEQVGAVFGTGMAGTEAYGLLQGILAYGQAPPRGAKELLLLYSASPWMRAVVGSIAHRVADTNWRLYATRDRPGGKSFRYKQLQHCRHPDLRQKMLATLAAQGQLEEVTEHPMLDTLRAGNPLIDGRLVAQVTQIHYDLKGEGYWLKDRWQEGPLKGLPRYLWPIPPFWLQATPTVAEPVYKFQFSGWNPTVPETEVVRFTDVDPYNPYWRGAGVAQSLSDELQIDENVSKFIASYYAHNALPAAIVSFMGNAGAQPAGTQSPVSAKDEAVRLQEDFRQRHQGFDKAFQLYFTSRQIEVKTLTDPFDPKKQTELRAQLRDTILEAWSYPKELVGIRDSGNRNAFDTAEFRLEKYVIEPRREAKRHVLQLQVAPEYDDNLVVGYDSTVPTDKEFKLKVYVARPWDFTRNEARGLAGDAPVEGEDGDARPPMAGSTPAAGGWGNAAKGLDPEWTRYLSERRRKASGSDLDKEAISAAVDAIDGDALGEDLQALWKKELGSWGKTTLGQLGVDAAFDLKNPAVKAHLKAFAGERMDDITETTREKIRAALSESYDNGESLAEAKTRLREATAFDDARAELVARTEVLRSSNFCSLEAYKQSGVVEKKVWLATPVGDSRMSHLELDGTRVRLDEDFVDDATGASGPYPGAFGDPASDCNCRCAISPVVEEKHAQVITKNAAADYKATRARAEGWEGKAQKVIKRHLAKQLRAALAALS